jgi:glutamate--cysteine ligase
MDYKRQKEALVNYYRHSEKNPADFKIGVELEHFIVEKESLRAISYYEDNGIKDILRYLLNKGWQGHYEDGYLLALERNGSTVTLEPGGQFELSMKPLLSLEMMEQEYLTFLHEVVPFLDEHGLAMVTLGYQPESSIKDIPFIPKKRYQFMADHFRDKGKYAYNMMRGTASIHLCFDYASEEDCKRKFRLANALTTVMAALFDNAPFFEGNLNPNYCQRVAIWSNCDDARCGVVPGSLDGDFGYNEYAEYLLNTPVIFLIEGDTFHYTKEKPLKDVFDWQRFSLPELEHVLTMVFPDVRLKKYIEVRMTDAVPYPLNFSVIGLWKGLFYNEANFKKASELVSAVTNEDIIQSKKECLTYGLNATLRGQKLYELAKEVVALAEHGLEEKEKSYLKPLQSLIRKGESPAKLSKEKIHLGKKEALSWCILNNLVSRD